MISTRQVHLRDAHKTKQFWLIWAVLCLNVSAGIGVLGIASPMLQEIFGGRLVGKPAIAFTSLDAGQLTAIAAIAAGFTGLLSLFNIGGRFFWASLSDFIGRKKTYYAFFVIGILLYASGAHRRPCWFGRAVRAVLRHHPFHVWRRLRHRTRLSRRHFRHAIRGRDSRAAADRMVTAGIIGPVVVNYIREAEIAAGVQRAYVYDVTLYILASFLVVGFAVQLGGEAAGSEMVHERGRSRRAATRHGRTRTDRMPPKVRQPWMSKVILAWLAVGMPLAWGVWVTLKSAFVLFG